MNKKINGGNCWYSEFGRSLVPVRGPSELALPFTHKSIFRLETLPSAIFYQPERLELQQPSGNALGKSKDNIAV